MKTTQGWGWLAAGVLALGLNGFYQDGGAAWAHRAMDGVIEQVADRTRVLADLATERVDRVVESGSLVAARDETTSCRLASAMALIPGQDGSDTGRDGPHGSHVGPARRGAGAG